MSAAPALEHILALRVRGVGYKTLADSAKTSHTAIARILNGEKKKIRTSTLERILAVDESCVADGVLLPATETWTLLNELIERGYTRSQLAQWLGYKMPALQINRKFVRAETASKVRRLFNRIERGDIQRGPTPRTTLGESEIWGRARQ